MKNPKTVALRPRWWRTARKDWSVRARRKARRGARSRARGSYSDKNEFAEALKSIRNDLKEESIAGDEEEREREREREIYWALIVYLFLACKYWLYFWRGCFEWVSFFLTKWMNGYLSFISMPFQISESTFIHLCSGIYYFFWFDEGCSKMLLTCCCCCCGCSFDFLL